MATKERDLLGVLKLELEFLEGGGYRKGSSWRPPFIFEDSPTCLNYGDPERKRPCSECVLMSLVPAEFREGTPPCHYISLNEQNDTIQSLQQWSSPEELEAAVSEWLMNTIQKLELERAQRQSDLEGATPGKTVGQASKNLWSSKAMSFECLNPDCTEAFDYRRGRLFRFHNNRPDAETPEVAGCCVRHFWLCDGCSRTHVLEYYLGLGVVIRLRHGNLPDVEASRTVCSCPKSRLNACLAE